MFCSECGKPAQGKFCSHCGHPLQAILIPQSNNGHQNNTGPVDREITIPIHWDNEVRYDVLMRVPAVKDLIDRHAKLAKKSLSGEEILALYDKALGSVVPMEKLAGPLQTLYAKLGIRIRKERQEAIQAAPGRVIVRTLCFFAEHGQAIQNVDQRHDGCQISAVLPSNFFSLAGTMTVTMRSMANGTQVHAATHIPGQWFDMGKSKRWLTSLMQDLRTSSAAIRSYAA